jgi:uncharacterized protein (TIGR02996 family)
MAGEREAFLAAIAAAPDDDTPRLVYADWLDENGTEDDRARAALIRAQCRAELLPPGSAERKKLERAARAILKTHAERWTQDARKALTGKDWTFRRGFIDGVTISPTSFVKHGEELFRRVPTLRSVKFPNAANETTELAASPFLARLAAVDLALMCTCGWCSIDEELRDLFKSKHATNLKCLNVSCDRIDATGATNLARSKVLANLTELDLSGNPLGAEGAAVLAKAKHFGKLTALNLTNTALRDAGVEALALAKHFPALVRLNLGRNFIRAPGAKALVAAPFFAQLTDLDLSNNRITEAGARALAAAETPRLERLDLRGCNLTARATALLKKKFGKIVNVD